MKKELKKTIVKGSIFLLLALLVLLAFPGKAKAAGMKVKGKLVNKTSYRISWSGDEEMTHWRIRISLFKKNGQEGSFKTIKVNKKSKKSFTIKKLKKNRDYQLIVSGGVMKNGKFKATENWEIIYFTTAMPKVYWDGYVDYQEEINLCSPTFIDMKASLEGQGLNFKGYQIYRRKKGEKKFKKIKTVKKNKSGGFTYRDKKVKKGATYQYKVRTYGTYKGKKLYSPFSKIMTRSAVYYIGKYKMEKVSCSANQLVVKLVSTKYNAELFLDEYSLDISNDSLIQEEKVKPSVSDDDEFEEDIDDIYDEYEAHTGFDMILKAYSKDNKTWHKLPKDGLSIKGGQTYYLRFVPANSAKKINPDPKKQLCLVGFAHYNGLACFIGLPDGKEGNITFNGEMIH